jgi:hypothetical protein
MSKWYYSKVSVHASMNTKEIQEIHFMPPAVVLMASVLCHSLVLPVHCASSLKPVYQKSNSLTGIAV